jgi:uncharacterized membrane protein YcaP (DUF421 family)
LLLHKGALLPASLRRARVSEDEVRAALRAGGLAAMESAHAVVLETDGSFSVIPADARRPASEHPAGPVIPPSS